MQNLSVNDLEIPWSNKDNNAFYEAVKAEGLRKLAEKGGLATGCDLGILKPYWHKAQSVLEVGAGYGRVIDYLLKHGFKGKITAVERCKTQFEYLYEQFTNYKNVTLLHGDIQYLTDINERFDLILMLWSGIADFAPTEQKLIFIKLATLLNSKAKLVIETLPASSLPIGMVKNNLRNVYKQEINGATIHTYSMTLHEIDDYAKLAGLSKISHISYYTTTGRKRFLHILN